MAHKTTSNDILVKVDHNNLIYIDPNTVVSNGVIQQRQVEPENLVMYVNLEADLIPRTVLISGNESNQLISIAKGTLNFLQNKNGQNYDSTWTDAFTDITEKKVTVEGMIPTGMNGPGAPTQKGTGEFSQYDSSAQTFGIESVDIKILGVNLVPRITIRFIDVRGKTLFESPANSPYKAFFHLPWPIYYLTVKGYYGKAIKYRLHMIDFKSTYNSGNGNFEIETVFVGSTYAYLNDIPLAGILNAPYMFGIEASSVKTYNQKTGYYEKTLKKTSIGYVTLKSVYDEYKSKGLLPKDFPVKTLREVVIIARRLNKILEKEIFAEVVDPKVLAGVKQFEDLIQGLYKAVQEWKVKHITGEYTPGKTSDDNTYKVLPNEKDSYGWVIGATTQGTLEEIIVDYTKRLEANPAFGKDSQALIKKDGLKIKQASFVKIQSIKDFYTTASTVLVYYDRLVNRIDDIRRDFVEQRHELEKNLQDKMNQTVKDPNKGFGFEPTIRNIVGVLCANADTYVKLLKSVHTRAFNVANKRKEILQGVPTDSIGDDNIYPWPEVKKQAAGAKQNILAYPGDSDMLKKLQSDNPQLWPEVAFVEEYIAVSTYKVDPLTEKEGSSDIVSYNFESNTEVLNATDLSAFTYLSGVVPYYDKGMSSLLYEIWERARYITALDTFNGNSVKEQALEEFKNIQNQIIEDNEALEILKQQVTGTTELQLIMHGYSPFERWPYYESQLPTVPYISNTLSNDFSVKKYDVTSKTVDNSGKFPNLIKELSDYKSEDYRTKIYPFNSTTYKSYLPSKTFGKKELDLHGALGLRTNDAFISSPINSSQWIKDGQSESNLFNNVLYIQNTDKHILNTPYFHRQLISDFNTPKISGKYASSAYLLLNSLPFKDLDDTIRIYKSDTSIASEKVLMSSIFREIGASHFIPYHLMVKWGSIYHRYKTYIQDGVDIISNVADPIDPDMLFDNHLGRVYFVNNIPVDRVTYQNNIGLYPFYHSIFHQIVHGYAFYDPTSPTGNTQYESLVTNGTINDSYKDILNNVGWTSIIDNSKFIDTTKPITSGITETYNGYTLLPCNGDYNYYDLGNHIDSEQDNLRILWDVETLGSRVINYTGETFPTYDQYFNSTGNTFSLTSNNKKVIDLIATFKPDILDIFEQAFLDFASENINDEIPYSPYNVKYSNFQSLLKGLVFVKKETTDPLTSPELITTLINKQNQNLINVSSNILGNGNLIKLTLANPKEIDPYSLYGITGIDSKNFDVGEFFPSQVTQDNLDFIELYLGEDMDGYYLEFFSINKIALNEANIKGLRFLIYTYAGARASGITFTSGAEFATYIKTNVVNKSTESKGTLERQKFFLQTLISQFASLKPLESKGLTVNRGYNDNPLKLEIYNTLKSFNDKWVAGNSLGQKTIFEEMLFLDKANRDIGDQVFLSMDRLMTLMDQGKLKSANLYSALVILIQNTGFDMRVLPAYVNFYGTNFSNTKAITPSKNVAKNLFGTFLEVDYQDSTPKVILQYTGPSSSHLELSDIDKDAKFRNDSFNMSDVNNNPIIVGPDVFRNVDYSKSNKAVAFEISFGDQNQAIFKGLELSQNTIKNSSQTYDVLERLGNSETGSSTAQIDIALHDIYRTASYACTVTAMGNVMIQPTMYFYLKNIPMFRGSYWITEVSHMIKGNSIETTFMGRRLALQSLPDPKDSFLAGYRALFDTLTQTALAKVNQANITPTELSKTEDSFDDGGVRYTINPGPIKIGTYGEKLIKQAGITPYGIAYNGYDSNSGYGEEKYIQLISSLTGKGSGSLEWLRTTVLEMDGPEYKLTDGESPNPPMMIISRYKDSNNHQNKISWSDIKGTNDTQQFYSSRFNIGFTSPNQLFPSTGTLTNFTKTEFYNPKGDKYLLLPASYDATNKKFTGPIHCGPYFSGLGMSKKLMRDLGLFDGNVVYFRLIP